MENTKIRIHIPGVFIIIALSLICRNASAQYLISQSVFGSGNINISDSAFSIAGTLGQPAIGITSTSSNYIYSGFWYLRSSFTTGLKDQSQIAISFGLMQNYPNPFNPSTTINYSLPKAGNVKLTVYNAIGSKVATIINDYKPVGNYSVQFNGSNLASGIYLYRLESGNYSDVKKFVLMK